MNPNTIKKALLTQDINLIPDDRLDEVQTFIEKMLLKTGDRKRISLAGIWKDAGFEQIENLESDIEKGRAELESQALTMFNPKK